MTEMPPKQWTIVSPVVEDAEAISRMHAQSWRDTYPDIQPGVTKELIERLVVERKESPEAIEKYRGHIRNAIENPDTRMYRIAKKQDGEVVGLLLASKDEHSQHLHSLYVDKDFQGSGLAQYLMTTLDDWLDPKVDTVLEVALGNDRATRFYEKLGFQTVPDSENDPGDGIVEQTMIKPGVKDEV